MHYGEEIHGEVTSADASSGVAFTLYDSGGVAARTLDSGEYLVITSVSARIAAGVDALVAADTDAAGRRAAYLGAGTSFIELCPPFICPRGVVPKLIADAGQVDVVLQGYVQKA